MIARRSSLRLAGTAVLVLALLLPPAVSARGPAGLPGDGGNPIAVLWNFLLDLLESAETKNQITIDPNGATATENRGTIDPNGATTENRITIDPNGAT
jgi:hypothetical protein